MNAQEELESQIATCKCCLLTEGMKDCPLCHFNIGLAERVELNVFMLQSNPKSTEVMALFALAK